MMTPTMSKTRFYVYWIPDEEGIRVGQFLSNLRKRPMTRIPANNGCLVELVQGGSASRLLFNPINVDDHHWIASDSIS